ncbi:MAG: hypothetical protein IPK82_08840 [Polyangiaceae bacterium]|nr:hypothetical protein [Polyangiaceae bacterium]
MSVLKRGKIRVDARKAIAKMRDHLLVDLHLYAVEVARAAVLGGATRIDITYDADDVVITFDGAAIEPEDLPRLFEHLTEETEDDSARRLRLFALAVNASLGLSPAWIALTTSRLGQAHTVEWTPELIAALEREQAPLPDAAPVTRPSDMPQTGTRFHFHRKMGWDVVRRAAAKQLPREIELLLAAAEEPRIAIFVNGSRPIPPPRLRVLAKAPIRLQSARNAAVEVLVATQTAPHIVFRECGFTLAKTGFSFGSRFPMAEHEGIFPPVRVVIDADELPTNASRSAVREDSPFFSTLAHHAAPALSDLLLGLASAFTGKTKMPEGVTVDIENPAAVHNALGAFLCAAHASIIARVHLPDALRSVVDLPLFRDGLGRPMNYRAIPTTDPLLLWSGERPIPKELALWASNIIWASNSTAERIFVGRTCLDQKQFAQLVENGTARIQKLLKSPGGPPSVPDDNYILRESFQFEDGPLSGLTGEFAIVREQSAYVRNMALRVFFQGRCFETLPIGENVMPLPLLIAIEWPGRIIPKFAYQGLDLTESVNIAVICAVQRALLACERLAQTHLAQNLPIQPALAALFRAAMATPARIGAQLASTAETKLPTLESLTHLLSAPVWPVIGKPHPYVSLNTLAEYASRTGAVCVVSATAEGTVADDRPVVRVESADAAHLRAVLHPDVALIRYDTALVPPHGQPKAAEQMLTFIRDATVQTRAPVLRVNEPNATAYVTVGNSVVRYWHGNTQVGNPTLAPYLGGVSVAISDNTIVPTPGWDNALYSDHTDLPQRVELVYAEKLVWALFGDQAAREELYAISFDRLLTPYTFPTDPRNLPIGVISYLIDRAARAKSPEATEEDKTLAQRIELLPLLTMIGESGAPEPVSLSTIDRYHPPPAKIPSLKTAPKFRPVRWKPLISADQPGSLLNWSQGRIYDAGHELFAQERNAAHAHAYEQLASRPQVDVTQPGEKSAPNGPTVYLAPLANEGLHGVAAGLPAEGQLISNAFVEILYQSRPVFEHLFTSLALPMIARVEVVSTDYLEGSKFSPKGEKSVEERLIAAAAPLALKIIERASESGKSGLLFDDLRALRLVYAALSISPQRDRIERALKSGALLWPTVHGNRAAFQELRFIDGELWVGTVNYASWLPGQPSTDLDKPIAFTAPTEHGSLIVGMLERMRVKLRAVSDALAQLQLARTHGASAPLRLAERPDHPALAVDLQVLFHGDLQGELAIYPTGEAVAEINTLDGQRKRIDLDLTFPARAVVRMDVLTQSAIPITAERLSRAAVRHILGLASKVDELPPYVRTYLRALASRAFSKGREVLAQLLVTKLFPDIDGRYWSLHEIQQSAEDRLTCTFDPPPYPKARQDGVTLILTPTEHLQLHAKLRILNVTEWMRRDLEAERRREAPPALTIEFDQEARSHFVMEFRVNDGALTGEVGILHPAAQAARGIQVYTNNRLVCRIDDGPGYPLAAVVNNDTFHPNRWFNEIAPAEETALRATIRRLAQAHAKRTLFGELPPNRLAETFLEATIPPVPEYGSVEPITIVACLYLPAIWPVIPKLRFFVQDTLRPVEHGLQLARAPIHAVLPVEGTVYIHTGDQPFTSAGGFRLALALRTEVQRLIEPLLKNNDDDREVPAYQWNLRLLGAQNVGHPTALAADGKQISADAVIQAIGYGAIWLTDRRGSLDGAFPEGAPPFVLEDLPSPLLRVLRARLPTDKFRLLGGLDTSKKTPSLAPPPREPSHPAGVTTDAPPESKRQPERSWFVSLIDRVFGRSNAGFNEPPPTGIGDAVERALRAMRLRDDPVATVTEVKRGRLVRYDKSTQAIFINVAHPSVVKILTNPTAPNLRRACLALTAAALSEVNIDLLHITEQDESAALLELLRQEAASSAGQSQPAL